VGGPQQPQRQAPPKDPTDPAVRHNEGQGAGVADMGTGEPQPTLAQPGLPSSADVQAQFTTENPRPPAMRRRQQLYAKADTRMRNASQALGFYRGSRIRPGRTFTLRAGDPVGAWMEPMDPSTRDELQEALDASPKRRGSFGVELKKPARRVTGLGTFEPGANSDEGI
jgi:hypothetical protein